MRLFTTIQTKKMAWRSLAGLTAISLVSLLSTACDDASVSLQTLQVQLVDTSMSQRITAGTSLSLLAQGTFSDQRTLDLTNSVSWTSSDPAIASVSNAAGQRGVVTGVAPGMVIIKASFSESDQTIEQSLSLEVTNATLTSVQVNPLYVVLEKGSTQQYTAMGLYSDGHTTDVTNQAMWSSSNPQITVSTSGLATMNGLGNANITAQFGGITSSSAVVVAVDARLTSIELTTIPAGITSTPSGIPVQYIATGRFSDGTTLDITSAVTWSSSATSIATISNAAGQKGIATGVAPGMTTIRAAWKDIQANAALEVTDATLDTIEVTAPAEELASGRTLQFTATGTFSDGTTRDLTAQVAWATSKFDVASIDASGLLTAKSRGRIDVTAVLNGVTGHMRFGVTDAILDSVEIATVPAMIVSIPKGLPVQYTATGHFSDGTSQDITSLVTWSVDNATIASISNKKGSRGFLTTGEMGMGTGTVTVTATQGTVTSSTTLVVSNAVLRTISVSPIGVVLAKGTKQAMKAIGTYSDGTTVDITASVQWTATDVLGSGMNVATFSGMDPVGTVTGKSEGKATLTATMPMTMISGSTVLTVTEATLRSIAVNALTGSTTVARGSSKPFVAVGTFSDGSTQEITSSVNWSSSDKRILTVTDTTGDHGVVTGVKTGSAQVTASWKSISGSVTVTVT